MEGAGIGLLIGWGMCGMLSLWVASQKDRSLGEGFVLGLLFGPLGVLVEALMPKGSYGDPDASARYQRKPPARPPAPKRWEKPLRRVDEGE